MTRTRQILAAAGIAVSLASRRRHDRRQRRASRHSLGTLRAPERVLQGVAMFYRIRPWRRLHVARGQRHGMGRLHRDGLRRRNRTQRG